MTVIKFPWRQHREIVNRSEVEIAGGVKIKVTQTRLLIPIGRVIMGPTRRIPLDAPVILKSDKGEK